MSGLQFSFAEVYERELVEPLFRPWAAMLLDRAGVSPGQALLDVGCGTGIVARLARERVGAEGRVVGVDASPHMLAVARAVAPEIDFREGKAEALPVAEDAAFDVVTCQQALQFFPDQAGALRQMRRVLRPGGCVAVATWCAVDEHPFVRDLHAVAERRLGPVADQRYGFGDGSRLAEMLADAGFAAVAGERLSYRHRFADGRPFVRLNARALVAMSAAGRAMSDAEKDAVAATIATESAAVLAAFGDGDEPAIAFSFSSHMAVARAV